MGFFDSLLGGVTSGAMDLIGGQLDQAQNRQAMRFARDEQENVLKHQIQWRIEDAQRAGIHPLAAMGMMPASITPLAIGGTSGDSFARAGQSFGGAVTRGLDPDAKALENAQLKQIEANTELTHTQRAAIASDMGLKQQNALIGQGLGTHLETPGNVLPEGQTPNAPMDRAGAGFEEVKAAPIISHRSGSGHIQAGISPDLEEIDIGSGLKWLAPAARGQESHMEIWGELPWYEKLSNILRNQAYYGGSWLQDFLAVKGAYADDPRYKTYKRTGNFLSSMSGMQDAIDREIKKQGFGRRYKFWKDEYNKQYPGTFKR